MVPGRRTGDPVGAGVVPATRRQHGSAQRHGQVSKSTPTRLRPQSVSIDQSSCHLQGDGEPQPSAMSCTEREDSEGRCKSKLAAFVIPKKKRRRKAEPFFLPLLQGGVWGEVCRLKDKYLTVLRVCIGFSRNYYLAEVKSLREGEKQKAKGEKEISVSQTPCRSHFDNILTLYSQRPKKLPEPKDRSKASR